MSYKEYLREHYEKMGINKDILADIRLSDDGRFYCPTCEAGTSLIRTKCSCCGQLLQNPWE